MNLVRQKVLLVLLGLTFTTLSTSPVKAQTTAPCSSTGNSTTNHVVCTASYLSTTGTDAAAGVEIGPDRSIVLAGDAPVISGKPIFLTVPGSPAQGKGVIVRLNPSGRLILSVTRLGNTISDLDINRTNGVISVIGDFGLAVLSPQANQVLWSKDTSVIGTGTGATASSGRRVAVGGNGSIATLTNKKVNVFAATGQSLGQFNVPGSYVEDIALDTVNASVIVTGYSQKDDSRYCGPLQVAFVRSYSYSGSLKWQSYDWTNEQAKGKESSCADSRGLRVAIGRDNKLYFAGESAGGNSIFRYKALALAQTANNVGYDNYTQSFNTASNHITYYSRLSLTTGEVEVGQFLLARLDTGKGNTIRPRSISADEQGNVYLGGVSTYAIANRSSLTISGQPLGAYSGGDGFLLVAPPTLSSRKIWTAWTGTNTTSLSTTIQGVAVAQGSAAVIMTSQGKMVTVNPLQSSGLGGDEMFFSVFPAR